MPETAINKDGDFLFGESYIDLISAVVDSISATFGKQGFPKADFRFGILRTDSRHQF